MSIAALVKTLLDAGVDHDVIVAAVAAVEVRPVDAQAERRRAADRERKRVKAEVLRNSAESAEVPSPPEMVPLAPFPNPIPNPPLNPPTPQPVRRERRTFPDLFERFWSAYPRREGANPKQPAAQKFDRIVAAGVDPETIIAAARRLAASMAGKDAKFVPQAVTWLNQARWQDEDAKQDTEPIQAVFVVRGTPQWHAWTKYRGREPIATHHGGQEGQFMKTEWPPQENAA